MKIRDNSVAIVAAFVAASAMMSGAGASNVATSARRSQSFASSQCRLLQGVRIERTRVGLATLGATIVSTELIAGSGSGAGAIGDYCLVGGAIKSVDRNAPSISFVIALPKQWNGKALMLGGAGFDGSVPAVAGNVRNTTADARLPLGRGYAVFASDSGHQTGPGAPAAAFSLNEEAFRNYQGEALKKTHDVAMGVIGMLYRRPPRLSYFVGSSYGGREALLAAERWPRDWDGIVSLYPSQNYSAHFLNAVSMNAALSEPGAYLTRAKRGALHRAALLVCDKLDGLADGIISDVQRCNAVFDPRTVTVDGIPLRCQGGTDAGDTCLSDKQLLTLERINNPAKLGFKLANGEAELRGFNVYTSDLGIEDKSGREGIVAALAFGNAAPTFPITANSSVSSTLVDGYVRFIIAQDQRFDPFRLNVRDPGPYVARIRAVSNFDKPDQDLSAFYRRGGKLLLLQGLDDMLVSPRLTEHYYRHLRSQMGAKAVDGFLRFYEVAGFGHSISTVYNASWDQLTALENWVERGVDPGDNQVVVDSYTASTTMGVPMPNEIGTPRRSRPLCRYPTWPKYIGTGDPDDSRSFKCSM